MKTYKNFEEFKKENEKLAIEIIDVKGEGEWQNEQIHLHNNQIEFAEYEVLDGWYSGIIGDINTDFNGAPNLFDYIDYESLSVELIHNWDESINYYSNNTGKIVVTTYGW